MKSQIEQETGNESMNRGAAYGSASYRCHHPIDANSQLHELMAVLEECGVSAAGFEALRKDAYEKCIAAESVASLERVYEALLDPALGLAQVRAKCPAWPVGSNYAGKLPSLMTLRDIKERILLEWSVREKLRDENFAGRLRQAAPANQAEFYELAMSLLQSELISAKFQGQPISENLRVLDRILRMAGMKLRLQKENSEIRGTARADVRPTLQKEIPKTNLQAPEKTPIPKAKAATVQGKPANDLLDLVPSLDLGLGMPRQFNGRGYDAAVKSVAAKILGEMAVGGLS